MEDSSGISKGGEGEGCCGSSQISGWTIYLSTPMHDAYNQEHITDDDRNEEEDDDDDDDDSLASDASSRPVAAPHETIDHTEADIEYDCEFNEHDFSYLKFS